MGRFGAPWRNLDSWWRSMLRHYGGKSELQVVKIVVTDFDVVEG
jgi:hypothetical protein